ncbi:MAG TPA: tetratricopeptide repeat protein [Polyangiales bacterium]|nr:tetratricopeptide repeat protein [Polyangiales bacterium]
MAFAAGLSRAEPAPQKAPPAESKRPAPAAASGEDGESARVRGLQLLRAGKIKEGEQALKQSARARGNSIDALYDLARVQFAADDYAKSRQACRALAAKDRQAMLSDLCMARAFLVWRRASRAVEWVDKALAKAPNDPEVLLALADMKRVSGDLDASRSTYQRVLGLQPGNPDAHYGLGELYLVAPDPEAARKAFAAALVNAPEWPDAMYQLGRLERGTRAVELLERAVTARPNWPEARLALGAARLENGEVEAAEALFRQVLKTQPKLPLAHARLGMALAAKRDYANAETEIKRGLEGLPNDADAALTLARIYANTDRAEDAFEAYRNAASLEKSGSRALVEAGVYAMKLDRNTLAQGYLEKAVERTPKSAIAQARFADVLLARGEKSLAKQHYQLALGGEGDVDRQDLKRRLDALK